MARVKQVPQTGKEQKGSEERRVNSKEGKEEEDTTLEKTEVLKRGENSIEHGDLVKTNLFTAMGSPQNSVVVSKLLLFSILMGTMPLGVFFYMRDRYLPSIGVREKVDIISGVSAVLCVQAIIALYVVMAFAEKTDDLDQDNNHARHRANIGDANNDDEDADDGVSSAIESKKEK